MNIHIPGYVQQVHLETNYYDDEFIHDIQQEIAKKLHHRIGTPLLAPSDMVKSQIHDLVRYQFPYINPTYIRSRTIELIVSAVVEKHNNIMMQSEQMPGSVATVSKVKATPRRRRAQYTI